MDASLTLEQERIFVIGLQQQQRRLQQLLARVAQPEVWDYLDEAARCFGAGAYSAAVVMGWNAVIGYYRLVARLNHDLFIYCVWAQRSQPDDDSKRPTDWKLINVERIKDLELIQACERMGMMSDLHGKLNDFQAKRNNCAHPNRVPLNHLEPVSSQPNVQPSEVVALLEQAVDLVLGRQIRDEKLRDKEGVGIILEFLKVQKSDLEPTQIADLLDLLEDKQYRFLAHRLRESYRRDDPDLRETNLARSWQQLWLRLDEAMKREQLSRIAKDMAESVRCRIVEAEEGLCLEKMPEDIHGGEVRSAVELTPLLLWPPFEPDSPLWGMTCESLIRYLEEVATPESTDIPNLLLKRLREHAPVAYQERIATIRDRFI